MIHILITGASGNVGQAILQQWQEHPGYQIWKASSQVRLAENERFFDFNDLVLSAESLIGIDILFLLRPPQLTDTEKYFAPLIRACREKQVKHIVFLSVQGVENHSIIPHAKIEKKIVESAIPYTFIRPSYFMQNLTTTLKEDIRQKGLIFLPAGKAKFLWVNVEDIGKAIVNVLVNSQQHRNTSYTITGTELFNFAEVARLMSYVLGKPIRYQSPNIFQFFMRKRKEGVPASFIAVMLMLHLIPRFEKEPAISSDFYKLTGQQPNTLENFIRTHQSVWL